MLHGKEREASAALDILLPPREAAAALVELTAAAANDKATAGRGATWQLLKSPTVLRELRLGERSSACLVPRPHCDCHPVSASICT